MRAISWVRGRRTCGTSSKTTRTSRTRLKRRSRQPWVSVSGRRKRPHRYPSTSDGGARPLRLATEPACAAGSHRPGGTGGDDRPPTGTPLQTRGRRAGNPHAVRSRAGVDAAAGAGDGGGGAGGETRIQGAELPRGVGGAGPGDRASPVELLGEILRATARGDARPAGACRGRAGGGRTPHAGGPDRRRGICRDARTHAAGRTRPRPAGA